MARPRRTFNRGQSTRRRVGWEEGPGASAAENFLASGSAILGAGLQVLEDGVTLVRTRGSLSAFLVEAVSSPGDGFHCAIGIQVVTNDAFAIGITAMPTPISDMQFNGWLYHRFFDVHAPNSLIPSGGDVSQVVFEVDSKAMRKVSLGDTIVAVLEVVEIGSADMDLFFDSRMLFKLA